MKTISIAMRTIDRDKHGGNHLGQTLTNLNRSGVFDSVHFKSLDLVDSGSENPEKYYFSEVDEDIRKHINFHFGNTSAFSTDCVPAGTITANECATEAHVQADAHNSDFVIFCEDDIDVCHSFLKSVVRWIEDHYVEECVVYPMCAAYKWVVPEFNKGLGYWDYPNGAFYGTQCYVIPGQYHKSLCDWLIKNPQYKETNRCHDLRLRLWASSVHGCETFRTPSPSFVQHIQEWSSMNNKNFGFRSWPGRKWEYKGKS